MCVCVWRDCMCVCVAAARGALLKYRTFMYLTSHSVHVGRHSLVTFHTKERDRKNRAAAKERFPVP